MVISIRRHRNQEIKNQELLAKNNEYNLVNLNKLKAWDPSQYRIKRLIHDSGSIRIYHADHINSNHQIVIKRINLDSEEFLDSFIHEIRTISKLRHANIIPLLTSFTNDHYLWNIVGNAELGSVDLWSKPFGLPELAIAFIIKDVLLALNYLHKRGNIFNSIYNGHL